MSSSTRVDSRPPRRLAGAAFVLLATLAAGLPPAAAQDDDVTITWQQERARKIRLFQEAFRVEGDRGARPHGVRVDEVLHNDLELSSIFSVTRGWLPDERPFDVQAVIEGKLTVRGSEVTLVGEVKDFPARRLISQSVHRGSLDQLRQLTHRFADDVVYQLTGERGIAETKIAYVSGKTGQRDLWIVDYDGHGPRQLTRSSVAVSPAFAPDGDRIAFSWLHEKGWGMYTVPTTGGGAEGLFTRGGLNLAPSYTPDGNWVAFSSSFEGNSEIYIVPANGSGAPRRLTKNRAIDTAPSWAPSGQRIAFTSDRSGSVQVYVMDADGANARRLVYGFGYTDSPAWSPRGDRVAFVVRQGAGFDVYTVDIDGRDPRLVVTGGSNQNPRWSPDGRHLVYASNRGGSWGLWVTDADGLNTRRLSLPGVEVKSPAWSPRPGSAATALGSR